MQKPTGSFLIAAAALILLCGSGATASSSIDPAAFPPAGSAQAPRSEEVRQLVTFSFLPGASGEGIGAFRDRAVPLYRDNPAMLSFRGFREVESPVALDLIVVSAFEGMAGMDDSNAALAALAREAGTSIGAIYGEIGALSSGHTDEFVEMLPDLGAGDPSSTRLTAFVRYRVVPGEQRAFEDILQTVVVPWEEASAIPSATGRFLFADGWDYLRLVGIDSLGGFQRYRLAAETSALDPLTAARREVIVASVAELSVR